MIPVTFQSVTAYLLDDLPQWSSMELEAALPADREIGLTRRETRRPLADTIRLSIRYTAVVYGTNAAMNFRESVAALTTEKVLCPLWCARFEAGASPAVTTAFYVQMGDGAAPTISAAAGLPFARPAFPLLVGRLETKPELGFIDDVTGMAQIDFVENDALAVTFPAYAPPAFNFTFAGMQRPLFPWRPNWAGAPRSGNVDPVDRQQVGQGRVTADSHYTQLAQGEHSQTFTLQGMEPWQLLRLLIDWGGTSKNFWFPVALSPLVLSVNVAPSDTTITATGGPNTYSKVLLDDLTNRVPLALNAPTSDVYPVTPSPVGTAFDKAHTRAEALMLCRLASASIVLHWRNGEVAETTIKTAEVPWENNTHAGETLGTTMGMLPTCAYVYMFMISYPGFEAVWRFTDFERDLTCPMPVDGTALAKPIEHGNIRETLGLERQQVTIKARHWTDNPLARLIPFTLEWPLMVRIYEVDITGSTASNLRCVFVGEVVNGKPRPPMIEVVARSFGGIFDSRFPRRLLQPGDNWALFETENGLLASNWEWTGTVSTFNPTTLELALTSVSRVVGSPVTLSAHFFAGGYLRFGSGGAAQYRQIADNAAASGSNITLTMGAVFQTDPVASNTVWFYPGYDGRAETARDKFANLSRFGGFPYMPAGNPSFIKPSKDLGSAGKK